MISDTNGAPVARYGSNSEFIMKALISGELSMKALVDDYIEQHKDLIQAKNEITISKQKITELSNELSNIPMTAPHKAYFINERRERCHELLGGKGSETDKIYYGELMGESLTWLRDQGLARNMDHTLDRAIVPLTEKLKTWIPDGGMDSFYKRSDATIANKKRARRMKADAIRLGAIRVCHVGIDCDDFDF